MSSIEKRLDELKTLLNKFNYQYYILDSADVPDSEYDRLYKELVEIEADNPHLISMDSPTKRVGTKIVSKLEPIIHKTKMYSLNNVFDESSN